MQALRWRQRSCISSCYFCFPDPLPRGAFVHHNLYSAIVDDMEAGPSRSYGFDQETSSIPLQGNSGTHIAGNVQAGEHDHDDREEDFDDGDSALGDDS